MVFQNNLVDKRRVWSVPHGGNTTEICISTWMQTWKDVFRCFCADSRKPPTQPKMALTEHLRESLTPFPLPTVYGMIYLHDDTARGGAMCTRHDRNTDLLPGDQPTSVESTLHAQERADRCLLSPERHLVICNLIDEFYPRFCLLVRRGCFRADRLIDRVRHVKTQTNCRRP